MRGDFDIAVVGSGFSGSLLAMIAKRLGCSVVLIERGKHPRFAIGESSTPLANLLLEELARRYDLPRLLPLTKWGTWQQTYPLIAGGLKRGFSFFQHRFGEPFADSHEHRRQLLVAASPHDRIADTHWHRADFDAFLVREAQALGVEYVDEMKLGAAEPDNAGCTLRGQRGSKQVSIRARFVFDASGPRGFLHRAFGLSEVPFETLPLTQGLYTHFVRVKRWEETVASSLLSSSSSSFVLDSVVSTDEDEGRGRECVRGDPGCISGESTLTRQAPPFPVDDAALHHVFEGGWIWVLRFNNGVTSAGVAATETLAHELNLAEGASAWPRLLARLPSVRAQFAEAQAVHPFVYAPRLPFLSGSIADRRWALLPSAAGVIDPLLSTGFPLTLLGIKRLAALLEQSWGGERFCEGLFDYSMRTTIELVTTERLVAALYASMGDFELFSALSLLYFAAASFTETAHRLGRPELAGGSFLLSEHEVFGPRFRHCLDEALRRPVGSARARLLDRIFATIEPVDIAGLGNRARNNWHPIQASDLQQNRKKLGASQDEVERLLTRCGFADAQSCQAAQA